VQTVVKASEPWVATGRSQAEGEATARLLLAEVQEYPILLGLGTPILAFLEVAQ